MKRGWVNLERQGGPSLTLVSCCPSLPHTDVDSPGHGACLLVSGQEGLDCHQTIGYWVGLFVLSQNCPKQQALSTLPSSGQNWSYTSPTNLLNVCRTSPVIISDRYSPHNTHPVCSPLLIGRLPPHNTPSCSPLLIGRCLAEERVSTRASVSPGRIQGACYTAL